jgi:hypothetical protein
MDSLEAPFSVDTAPKRLVADDPPAQQSALRAALRCGVDEGDALAERFLSEPVKTASLHFYKRLYEERLSGQAAQSLLKRHRLSSTSTTFNVDPDSKDLAWSIDRHFIDLKIYVGNGLGLGGMMPNQYALHTYELELKLHRPDRSFKTKFAKLGFDPVGCMLWIGRSPNAEDVWLAWAPTNALEGTEDELPAGSCSGDTSMSEAHYRRVVMFLAHCITEMRYRDALVGEKYPNINDSQCFRRATNIL